MRILLGQNAVYYPTFGGANKSNRLLLEDFVRNGHECEAVASASGQQSGVPGEEICERLALRGATVDVSLSGEITAEISGVRVYMMPDFASARDVLVNRIREFLPHWVLISSEDPGQRLLEAAIEASAGRVVFLARTTLSLPFGPDAAAASAYGTKLIAACAGVAAVSGYLRDYLRQYGGISSEVLPISLHDPAPKHLGSLTNEYVTMFNPCAVKGIAVFDELASRTPHVRFAVVPGWGTTSADMERLRMHNNVDVLSPSDDVDKIYARTRVLLVPSLWAEARARVIVESLSRGIPVIASDAGGNREAMLGLPVVIPVTTIKSYSLASVDERLLPAVDVPPQNTEPWHSALEGLLARPAAYDALAHRSRAAALGYCSGLNTTPFIRFLNSLTRRTPDPNVRLSALQNRVRPEIRSRVAAALRERRAKVPAETSQTSER